MEQATIFKMSLDMFETSENSVDLKHKFPFYPAFGETNFQTADTN